MGAAILRKCYRESRGSIFELVDNFNELFCNGYISEAECNEFKKDAYELIEILMLTLLRQRSLKRRMLIEEENVNRKSKICV